MLRLWKLAWPLMILGGIRVAMRTGDILIVGFLGSWAAASVGLGDVWLRLTLFVGLGIGAGTVARVAQGLGAGDQKQADHAMTQAVVVAVVIGLAATGLFWFYGPALIALLGAEARLIKHAGGYLQIVGLSAVPRMVYLVVFRGMSATKDTVTPTIIGFVTTVINILVTLVLVFGWWGAPALQVAGAAWGTFVGNLLAGAVCFWLLVGTDYPLNFCLSGLTDLPEAVKLVWIGSPRILNGSINAVGRIPLNGILLWFGAEAVAAYQIAFRVQMLAMMPNWGISSAAGTFSGHHLGAREPRRAMEQGWEAVKLALLVSGPVVLGIILLRHQLAYLFIREQPTLRLAAEFIAVVGLAILCYCVFRSLAGALEGAGHTFVPMIASAVGIVVLLGGAAWFGGPLGWGIEAVYAFILLGYLSRLLIVWGYYEYYRWGAHPAVQEK